MIARTATGEIEDIITTEDGKNATAVALGCMGGKARAAGIRKKRPFDRFLRLVVESRCYWQMCCRPSSPTNRVPGMQTKPLRRA